MSKIGWFKPQKSGSDFYDEKQDKGNVHLTASFHITMTGRARHYYALEKSVHCAVNSQRQIVIVQEPTRSPYSKDIFCEVTSI